MDSGLDVMKNMPTQPSTITVSYQWVTSMTARVRPLISVVAPAMISWCAWWLEATSKGDLRNLMVSTNSRPRKISGSHMTIGTDAAPSEPET